MGNWLQCTPKTSLSQTDDRFRASSVRIPLSQPATRNRTLSPIAIRLLTSAADLERYDAWVQSHPEGTLWQSLEWKRCQEALGRTVRIYVDDEAGDIRVSALVVIDRTTGGLSTWEVPRGPLAVAGDELRVAGLIAAIKRDAVKDRCLSLYFSPLAPLETRHSQLATSSRRHVHPEATRIIDLRPTEEEILAQMKQKGRYNIRLTEKNGVAVKNSTDIDVFARLMDETAVRDGFRPSGVRSYRAFLQNAPGAFLLLAYSPEQNGKDNDALKPIAGLLGAIWSTTGIYYYGASSYEQRELMAPYALQWAAMRHCKAAGCLSYDLFGVAPEGQIEHPWAGVSEFKAKFGGTYVQYPPEQEIVLRPVMKALLQMKRRVLG